MGDAPAALDVAAVSRAIGTQRVLRECSLGVRRGSLALLMGRNGSGKTTLMRLVAGLDPVDGGSVLVGGRPVRFGEPASVSYLAQNRPLYAALTVSQTIDLAESMNVGFDRSTAVEWIEMFDIRQEAKVGSLSGGQHTQVALAVALGKPSEVVVLDEPLADLDPIAKEQAVERLRAVASDDARAVLVSSHGYADFSEHCDHVFVLKNGQVVLDSVVADDVESVSEAAIARADAEDLVKAAMRGN